MKNGRKTKVKALLKYLAAVLLGIAEGMFFFTGKLFSGVSSSTRYCYYLGIVVVVAVVLSLFLGRRSKERRSLILVNFLSAAIAPLIGAFLIFLAFFLFLLKYTLLTCLKRIA